MTKLSEPPAPEHDTCTQANCKESQTEEESLQSKKSVHIQEKPQVYDFDACVHWAEREIRFREYLLHENITFEVSHNGYFGSQIFVIETPNEKLYVHPLFSTDCRGEFSVWSSKDHDTASHFDFENTCLALKQHGIEQQQQHDSHLSNFI